MKQIAAYLFGLVLLSSCAYHGGMMTANLPDNFDQEIIAQAKGRASAVYILGIGGLDHKYLVTDAKKNLYSNYPLEKGQAYANLVVDRRLFPFLLVNVNQIFVTADIVADPSLKNDSLQHFFEPPTNEKGLQIFSKEGIWIKANDEVVLVKNKKNEVGRVIRVLGRKKVMVTSPAFGEKKYKLRKFFLKGQNVRFKDVDYFVGQSVPAEYKGDDVTATVSGINHKYLLLQTDSTFLVRSIHATDELLEDTKGEINSKGSSGPSKEARLRSPLPK
jgi:signal peptidase I